MDRRKPILNAVALDNHYHTFLQESLDNPNHWVNDSAISGKKRGTATTVDDGDDIRLVLSLGDKPDSGWVKVGVDAGGIPDVSKSVMSPKYSITSRGGDMDSYVKVNIGDVVRITFSDGKGFREHVDHNPDKGTWTIPSGFKGDWNIEFNQLVHSESVKSIDNLGSLAPNWRFKLYQRNVASDGFILSDQFDYQKDYLPLNMRMPIDFFWRIPAYDFDAEYYCTMELLGYGKPNGDEEVFIPRQKPVLVGQEAQFNVPKNTYGYKNESPHPSILYSENVILSNSSYIEF